jgi:hypothetical protein
VAEREKRPELIDRALALAPSAPGLHVEAALEHRRPLALVGAVLALGRNLPALAWCLATAGAALGVAVLAASALLALVALARTLTLHGHALGHALKLGEVASAPATLALLAVLACLPLFGLGPGTLIAVCVVLAVLGASRGLATVSLVLLVASAAVLGPGLEYGSRIATALDASSALAAAWRLDYSEPLPGDQAKIEQAFAREPEDAFLALSVANGWKHLGETRRAEELLARAPAADSGVIEARIANLLGILRLARGDVNKAVVAFEQARALGENATILYNLSQAYARDVELIKREALYTNARNLDPELVSRYASLEGANVHSYVIQEPLPTALYLGRMLRATPQASALVHAVRQAWLGRGMPDWAWLLLLLAAAALPFRRSGLSRCRRCDRMVCRRCSPAAGAGPNCPRCEGLFGTRTKTDVRLRQQEHERDRTRQARLRRMRAAAGLAVPGLGVLLEERALAGTLRVCTAGFALGLGVSARVLPVPFEMASAAASPMLAAIALAGLLYALELRGLRALLSPGGRA